MPFLAHFAAYLPSRTVDNAELARVLGIDAARIEPTSGIQQRHFAAPGESVIDLAVAAGRRSLETSGAPKVDMLIVATGSAGRRFPGPATSVAHALNLGAIPAIDLPMASAGAVFGIALARGLADLYPNILVIAAEQMSEVVMQPGTHPNLSVLFGDGAGACIVRRDGGAARIVDALIASDGAFASILQLGLSGPMTMDGRTVIMQASRKIPEGITALLERHRISPQSVSTFLLHQANKNLIRAVAQALGVPAERFVSNIERCGNTSSASVLILMAEWAGAAGFTPGADVVIAGFGAGLHWGAILLSGHA